MNFKIIRRILISISILILVLIVLVRSTTFIQKAVIRSYYNITGTALFEGNGTKAMPYKIYAPEQLLWIAGQLSKEEHFYDKYFILAEDMDLSGGYEGLAIGSLTEGTSFGGMLEGDGHTISGLNNGFGLFEVLGGTVTNLTVEECNIDGDGAGSIAAVLGNSGKIINCKGQKGLPIAGVCYGSIINSVTGGEITVGDVQDIPNYAYPKEDELFAVFDEPVIKYCVSENENGYSIYDSGESCNAVEAAVYLESSFGKLDPRYSLRDWQQGETLKPAGKNAERIDRIYMDFARGGVNTVLEAFYSSYDEAWCFALPFESGDSYRIYVNQGAASKSFSVSAETDEYELDFGADKYKIIFYSCSDIPSIFMDSDDGHGAAYLYADKKNSLSGSMTVFDESGAEIGKNTVKAISGRGNDSYSNNTDRKNSYAVAFRGESELLGLPANDDFVFTSGFRFTSIYSYMFERDFMRSIKMPYVMDYRVANFYIDNEYQGMYLITGSQEISEDRFALKDLYKETKAVNGRALESYDKKEWKSEETLASRVWYDIPVNPVDITGGYLLELDLKDFPESRSRFTTDAGMSVTLKSNNYASKEQVDYVADMVQGFEDAVMSEDGYNAAGIYYADYIDMESFADELLLFELSQDTSMSGSFYFYKDSDELSDGKLHGAFHWDVERAFIEQEKLESDFSWVFGERHNYMKRTKMQCIGALGQHKDFMEVMQREWKEKFIPALAQAAAKEAVYNPDGVSSPYYYAAKYERSGNANHSRWYRCDGLQKAQDMQQYLSKRIANVDRYFNRSIEDMQRVDEAFWKK